MPAIINSPTHTELTLMDVRSAHEIAETLRIELEDGEVSCIGDWPNHIETLTGILRNVLVRHRVYPFADRPEDVADTGPVPVPEAMRHSQVVQAIALLVKQQATMQADDHAWALYVSDCCTFELLCDEIEQYELTSFEEAIEFYTQEAALYFDPDNAKCPECGQVMGPYGESDCCLNRDCATGSKQRATERRVVGSGL